MLQTVIQLLGWRRSAERANVSNIDELEWQRANYELLVATLMYADRYVQKCGLRSFSLFHLLSIASLCTVKVTYLVCRTAPPLHLIDLII